MITKQNAVELEFETLFSKASFKNTCIKTVENNIGILDNLQIAINKANYFTDPIFQTADATILQCKESVLLFIDNISLIQDIEHSEESQQNTDRQKTCEKTVKTDKPLLDEKIIELEKGNIEKNNCDSNNNKEKIECKSPDEINEQQKKENTLRINELMINQNAIQQPEAIQKPKQNQNQSKSYCMCGCS